MTEQEDSMNSGVLVCSNVVRRFLEGKSMLEVLSGVDLQVLPAERLAIIGSSAGRLVVFWL